MDDGPADGWPVILWHGFPSDVYAFDEVVPILADAGARILRPYCRGFGATRFRSDQAVRSGHWPTAHATCFNLRMGCVLASPSSAASTGVVTRPVPQRRCGRSGSAASRHMTVMT